MKNVKCEKKLPVTTVCNMWLCVPICYVQCTSWRGVSVCSACV